MPQNLIPQDPTQLDPKIVKVMGAIKKIESGGDYNAVGDNGQSHGAYQWNKDNFKNQATQFGLDPNDMSPANQNKVAYARIKSLKDQGRQPEEIAALWNGAKKTPEGTYTYINPEYGNKFRNALGTLGKSQGTPQTSGNFVNPNQSPSTETQFVQPPTQNQVPISTTPEQPKPGLLASIAKGAGDIYNSIASPFEGIAALPVQAGIAGLNKLTGSNIPDPFAKGVPSIGGENTKVTPLNLEKKAGDIAQVGSYFVPGTGILGAAGMGALQGAGSAMSEGGDIAQVGVGTGAGALIGGGTAGLLKGAGGILKSVGGALNGENLTKATQGIKDAYASVLNLNASERAFENRSGKDLAKILVEHQAPLGRTESGHLDASKAIPKLQEALAPLNQEADKILSQPQGVVKNVYLSDIENQAHSKIDAMTLPEVDKEDAKKLVSSYLKSEAKKYGGELSPAQADKIKQGFWAATFDRNRTNLQNHIPYLLGKTMQDATEKAIAGTDTETNLHLLNKQRGDLIDAIRRLQKMDSVKLLKGGRLGNIASGTIGAIAGSVSGLGPLGALAGDYFGQKAGEFLQNPATKIGLANAKAKATKKVGGMLGKSSKPVGNAVQKLGKGMKKSARVGGLLGNLLTK